MRIGVALLALADTGSRGLDAPVDLGGQAAAILQGGVSPISTAVRQCRRSEAAVRTLRTVDVKAAKELAERELAAQLPARWRHVQAVAAKGELVAEALGTERELLVSAAWLHDIGYSSNVAQTGFHPLDGARFLRARSVDERVVRLVAHHSCATVEAEERGFDDELRAEFPPEDGDLADGLWYCDMTTGPNGEAMSVGERLAEIRSRYGPEHVVTRFVDRAETDIRAAVERTEERLRAVEAKI